MIRRKKETAPPPTVRRIVDDVEYTLTVTQDAVFSLYTDRPDDTVYNDVFIWEAVKKTHKSVTKHGCKSDCDRLVTLGLLERVSSASLEWRRRVDVPKRIRTDSLSTCRIYKLPPSADPLGPLPDSALVAYSDEMGNRYPVAS